MTIARITDRFAKAEAENRAAFVAYMMGGDPDLETSFQCLKAIGDSCAIAGPVPLLP